MAPPTATAPDVPSTTGSDQETQSANPPQAARLANDQGNNHLNHYRYDDAIASYSEALEIAPNYANALASRGLAFLDTSQIDEARHDLEAAVRLEPENMWARFCRLFLFHTERSWAEQEAELAIVDSLDGDQLLRHTAWGLFFASISQDDDAIEAFNRAERSHSEAYYARSIMAKAIAVRGGLHGLQNNLIGAKRDLEQAIALDPSQPTIHSIRAIGYLMEGNAEEATASFDHAIALNPRDRELYHAKAEFFLLKDDLDEALKAADACIALAPYGDAHVIRAKILAANGDIDQAIHENNEAIRLDQNNYTAYTERGKLRVALDQLLDAESDFTKAIDRAPKDIDAYIERAQLYFHNDAYEAALADLDMALTIAPRNTTALTWRGRLRYRMGDKRGSCPRHRRNTQFRRGAI